MSVKHQLLVIGGGAGGLATAFGAKYLGMDVGLAERDRLGGECTWWGCIPSKTLIDVAGRAHIATDSEDLGIRFGSPSIDFAVVMDHVRSVSEEVAKAENEQVLTRAGIQLHASTARFVGTHEVQLDDGTQIEADRVVIATGADPMVPSGLAPGEPVTARTIWGLELLPDPLVIVGGGSVGSEFAQAFHRLGSDVHMITDADRLIPNDHPDASRLLEETFRDEGIEASGPTRPSSPTSGCLWSAGTWSRCST